MATFGVTSGLATGRSTADHHGEAGNGAGERSEGRSSGSNFPLTCLSQTGGKRYRTITPSALTSPTPSGPPWVRSLATVLNRARQTQ